MAYKKEDLEGQALNAIKKYNLYTVKDIAAYTGISLQTFYTHKLEESEPLKEAVLLNKQKTVHEMKKKWYKSDNATLQMGLMKLLGTDEDRQYLTQQNIDHTTKGEALPAPQVYMPADLPDDVVGLPPTAP